LQCFHVSMACGKSIVYRNTMTFSNGHECCIKGPEPVI
jgi:hypothetical protein